MKKTLGCVIIIFSLLVLTTSCKKLEMEFSWEKVAGSGSYSSQSNTSTIIVQGWLRIKQPAIARESLKASLADWEIIVNAGTTPVLTFLKNDHNSAVGDVLLSTSELADLWLYVYIETTTPKSGDIYKGLNPDNITVSMKAQDEAGATYTYTTSATFEFTRH